MLPRARPAPADVAPVTSVSRIKTDFALQRQEKALSSDPKYKKFQSHVDKTLQSFDSVAEWPDFITFLAKLLKTLQTYPQFTVIPHKLTVAKRLAQCLNPALPTGVHQRALDVYVHILNTIGPDNLRRDLAAWSSGLFPFFQYAATSVRPIVLGIYSKFYLPLQEALRPCTKAFILALLPGVEEETSEFFDKVSSLLDQLSGTVSPPFFFQHLWLILLTSPSSRVSALNYLSKRLPAISPQDRISPIVGDDPGLMIRGFAASLDHGQVLVQRGVLDLLSTALQIDGKGYKSEVRPDDQVLLMRSAMSIVLRRDLSLSRRLYTWLLGKSEISEAQIEYMKTHALGVMARTLTADWANAASAASAGDQADRQRPFRVFVSLLDRWEIGSVLTGHLVLDLFAALKQTVQTLDGNDEFLVTANMVFEGLDPYLTWQQFFLAVRSQLQSPKEASDKLQLLSFVCHTFKFHDAEIQRVHVPLLAYSLIDFVTESICSTPTFASQAAKLAEALHLLQDLLEEIPSHFYGPVDTSAPIQVHDQTGIAKAIADDFYSAPNITQARLPDASIGSVLQARGLMALLRAASHCATSISDSEAPMTDDRLSVYASVMDTVAQLLSLQPAIKLPWEPEEWLASIIPSTTALPLTQAGFDCLAACSHALVALQHASIEPAIDIDTRPAICGLTEKLLAFLAPQFATVHVEAVGLLWIVQSLTSLDYIESLLCQRMTSDDSKVQADAFEAFGNLWRLTEDEHMSSKTLVAPLFLVLDGTTSDNFVTRRAAEAWMRCHFRSYLRLVDPLLSVIADASVERQELEVASGPCTVRLHYYNSPFDQARAVHALSNLHGLFVSRGAAFQKVMKTTPLRESANPDVRGLTHGGDSTYLDVLCHQLINYLTSNTTDEASDFPSTLDLQLQSISIDLLQIILQRSDISPSLLARVRYAFLTRLLCCVKYEHHALENKLLHALHSTFQAKTTPARRRNASSSAGQEQASSEKDHETLEANNNTLLSHVLILAFSTEVDSAALHHWVDFVFLSVVQIHRPMEELVFPLMITVAHRVRSLTNEVQEVFDARRKGKGVASNLNDLDFVALAGLLERLVTYALADESTHAVESSSTTSEKSTAGTEPSGGFLTYMTGVLSSSEAQKPNAPDVQTSAPIVVHLNHTIAVLAEAYSTTKLLLVQVDASSSPGFVLERINTRAHRTLSRLQKAQPAEVLEALVLQWSRLDHEQEGLSYLELTHDLAPSAQNIVATTCDRVSLRSSHKSDKSKTGLMNHELTDITLLHFLETFIVYIDPSAAISVWNAFSSFVREYALAVHGADTSYLLPSLRIIVALAQKMAQTPALEDRRLRRELHDLLQRLLDSTLGLAAKSSHQLRHTPSSSSLRSKIGAQAHSETVANGGTDEKDVSQEIDEIPEGSATDEKSTIAILSPGLLELNLLLSDNLISHLRSFHFDSDRISLICNSIMQVCVSPAFNKRTPSFEVHPSVFQVLTAIVHMPGAQKSWKGAVVEWLYDNRLFNSPTSAGVLWKPIIRQLMSSDKERFLDLIGRITTATSANIFVNREVEALSKAYNVRRLSLAIWSGDQNKFLTQLPAIQEKLVDVLRASVGEVVHCEVYLCLRVLLCRMSQEHMTSFWPIVLTELLRTFEGLLDTSASSKDSLGLVLAACKFLDLLLTLQTEEFQIHHWMFVTDTVDAIYPPDGWSPQAVMDRLSIMISDHRAASDAGSEVAQTTTIAVDPIVLPSRSVLGTGESQQARRRPLLARVRQSTKLDSLGALEPFFGRISLYSFESAYAQGRMDWEAIAHSIEGDIFQG